MFSYIANGTTFSNNIFKPMISKGTEIKDFQKHGQKPSLKEESEVEGVTGDTENIIKNKNQLILTDTAETTYFGVTYSCKNGKIYLNGTPEKAIFIIIPLKKSIKVSKTFSWSAKTNKLISSQKKVSLWITNNIDTSKLFSKELWFDKIDPVLSITPEKETLIDRVQFYIASNASFDNITVETQLEYSEEVTEITEGKEELYSFSLADKVLYGDENVRDFFEVNIDEEFYQKTGYKKVVDLNLTKNWKKYILDGINNKFNSKIESSTNNSFVTTNILDILKPEINSIIIKSYSNYFKGDFSANQLASNDITGIAITTSGYFRIVFGSTSEINTLELANDKLQELNSSGHPLYIVYQLKEPEIENITNKELINQIENFINNAYTYKEKTSINSNFYLKLKYKKDKYFNLDKRLKTLEANTL